MKFLVLFLIVSCSDNNIEMIECRGGDKETPIVSLQGSWSTREEKPFIVCKGSDSVARCLPSCKELLLEVKK